MDHAAQAQAASSLVAAYTNTTVMNPLYFTLPAPQDAWLNSAFQIKMDKGDVERKMRCLIKQFRRVLKKNIVSAAAVSHVKWFAFLQPFLIFV